VTDFLDIDVVDPRLLEVLPGDIVVLVEPLYGCVAVAAALDAGWGEVEIAVQEGAAIPLVSFEQPPAPEHRGGRCRVRADDLVDTAWFVLENSGDAEVLLGAPALARPLCAQLATRDIARVHLVPALAEGRVAADATWACGMLTRVLLDELEARVPRLSDAAGVAVSLATGTDDPHAALTTGHRWVRHLELGGAADDARVAAAIDSLAVVPRLVDDLGVLIARPWQPWLTVVTPEAGLPAGRS
jgi:hypothetical protein